VSPDLVWAGVTVLVLFLEMVGVLGKRQGDTISELTRKYFHTDTPAGGILFGIAWVGFAVWYFLHILRIRPSRWFRRQ